MLCQGQGGSGGVQGLGGGILHNNDDADLIHKAVLTSSARPNKNEHGFQWRSYLLQVSLHGRRHERVSETEGREEADGVEEDGAQANDAQEDAAENRE